MICEQAGLADLVVIGREGAVGATARLLFSSAFKAVVRYSPRPVLVAVDPAAAVLRMAGPNDADLAGLGGYGHGRFLEMLFGHTVD